MAQTVHTLDLNFQNRHDAIAAYLIPHADGAMLVESGPGSTIDALQARLAEHQLSVKDITHVLLTHIHLDHAGAAGWLSRQGAKVVVHPVGAPHMIDPSKLIASATRIYQDKMETLWGEFLAVPEEQVYTPIDGETLEIGGVGVNIHFTPGHAEHHIAYGAEDIIFAGDIGGIRMPNCEYLRLPLVPPELNLEKWQASFEKLLGFNYKRIAPTHFSIFDDAEKHIHNGMQVIENTSRWLEEVMPSDPTTEALGEKFAAWMMIEGQAAGISVEELQTYEIANPLHMAATGLSRYWKKVRQAEN